MLLKKLIISAGLASTLGVAQNAFACDHPTPAPVVVTPPAAVYQPVDQRYYADQQYGQQYGADDDDYWRRADWRRRHDAWERWRRWRRMEWMRRHGYYPNW
jgi:hypothetical protein